MFTETRSRLGWRTGASRFMMKEELELLQSFDPAERAQAGQQLVELGLTRCAELLLDHTANEFDNRVLAAVAGAVVQAPPEPKESRKAKELREWAAAELERSALEEAFMGREPDAVAFPPEPDFQSADLELVPEPLPVRVPVGAADVVEAAAVPAPVEYRFEVPEPEAQPIEYQFEGPAPVAGYEVQAYEPETDEPAAPPFISWRPPADDDISGGTNGDAAGNGNGHDPEAWAELASHQPTPTLDAELIEGRSRPRARHR